MDLSALHSPQFSPSDISTVISTIFSDISLSAFEQSISGLYDPRVQTDAVAQVLVQVLQRLPSLENHSLQIEYAALALKVADTREILDPAFSEIQDLYCTILESHGYYHEVAKYLIEFLIPLPESENRLPLLLRIGENCLKSQDINTAFSYLTKMSVFIFRKATPPPLVERFDILRGYLHLSEAKFFEAARAFQTVWQTGVSPESRLIGLRRTCISALLAPASTNQKSLLRVCYQDDNVQSLDVFEMVDRIVNGKFVDAIARDQFTETVSDLVAPEIVRQALTVSSTQHNLSVAQHMFMSVRIPRIAQLIGDTPENVEAQLGEMIDAGTIAAEIDQPDGVVVFTSGDPLQKDGVILRFCTVVEDLVKCLKDDE
jgi:hypothetical protein